MMIEVLNSKVVFSRNRLPRQTIEKTEWEEKQEEIQKWVKEKQERRERQEGDNLGNEETLTEMENNMSEN